MPKTTAPPKAQDATLRSMVDEGLISLPVRRGLLPATRWERVKATGVPMSDAVIRDREDQT